MLPLPGPSPRCSPRWATRCRARIYLFAFGPPRCEQARGLPPLGKSGSAWRVPANQRNLFSIMRTSMKLRCFSSPAGRVAVLLVFGGSGVRTAAAATMAEPPPPAPMIVAGPGTARMRIEALDDHIIRLWFKPAGDFSRPPSLALAGAPVARVPLALREEAGAVTLSTAALTVCIDRATLGFEVRGR